MEPAGYPAYAVEGAMKVQEVILRAVDGRLKWYQAAEILGISDRQVRRWKRCDEQRGYAGLFEGCAARGGVRGAACEGATSRARRRAAHRKRRPATRNAAMGIWSAAVTLERSATQPTAAGAGALPSKWIPKRKYP